MSISLTPEFEKAGDGFLLRAGYGNLGAYATGGVTIDPRQMKLGSVDVLIVEKTGAYRFQWDKTNNKVMAYTDDGTSGISAEVADTTSLTAIVFRWFAIGAY